MYSIWDDTLSQSINIDINAHELNMTMNSHILIYGTLDVIVNLESSQYLYVRIVYISIANTQSCISMNGVCLQDNSNYLTVNIKLI